MDDLAATVVAPRQGSRITGGGDPAASVQADAMQVQVMRMLILAAQGSPVALCFLSRLLSMPTEAIKQLGRRHSNIFSTDQRHLISLRKVVPPKSDWRVEAPGEIPNLILVVKVAFEVMSRSQKSSCSYQELEEASEWKTQCPLLATELVFPRLLHYFERVAHEPKAQSCRFWLCDPRYPEWNRPQDLASTKSEDAELLSPSRKSKGPLSPAHGGEPGDTVTRDLTEEGPNQLVPDLYGLSPDGTPYHQWVFQIAISSMSALPTTPAPPLDEPMVMVSVTHEDVGARIWKFISSSLPSSLELEHRSELRKQLEGLLSNTPRYFRRQASSSEREAEVIKPQLYVFGSCATNTFVAGADMDLCLVYAKDFNGHLSRSEVQDKVEEMYALLKRDHRFKGKLCRVVHAKVPILKKGPPKCFDISLSSWCGVRNSSLIRKYVETNRMVQPMAIAVNGWSKWADINDGPSGQLNSYTLLLMLIHFLLRVGEVELIPIDVPLELVPEPPYQPPALQPSDYERLGRLAVWFFHFYTHEFRWDADVVCIRTTCQVTRAFKGWSTAPLAVEDPFETHLNTARNVGESQCRGIKAAFEHALDALLHGQFVDVSVTSKTKVRDPPNSPQSAQSPQSSGSVDTPKGATRSSGRTKAIARDAPGSDSAPAANDAEAAKLVPSPSASTVASQKTLQGIEGATALAQRLLTMSFENRAIRKLPEMKDPELIVYALRELCLDFGECKAVARACRVASLFFEMDPSLHEQFDELLLPLLHLKVAEHMDEANPGHLLEFCYLETPSLPRCIHLLRQKGDLKQLGKTLSIASHFARSCDEAVEALFQVTELAPLVELLGILTDPNQLAGDAAVPVVAAILKGLATNHQNIIQDSSLPSASEVEWFIHAAEWYHFRSRSPKDAPLVKYCITIAHNCIRRFPGVLDATPSGPVDAQFTQLYLALNAVQLKGGRRSGNRPGK
eukprot:GGOE01043421.1.p1 GENE.GGOE01043421.1~~GGOE01043421.1.p1  ORF type:complete len:981 (+),score=234.25 GGOE01043421.1:69-2945(+)